MDAAISLICFFEALFAISRSVLCIFIDSKYENYLQSIHKINLVDYEF